MEHCQPLRWLIAFALALSPLMLFGQTLPELQGTSTDWSDQHLIFSRPATPEQASRLEKDPRYARQLRRRASLAVKPEQTSQFGKESAQPKPKTGPDWSQDLGSGATLGARNFPAKYSFSDTQANCGSATQPDFVVYGTGLLGSATQASIVAYDNLYSGCGGTVPSVYWAFNTGGTVTTSPFFSADGKQVAFVQSGPGGDGYVVLLKWAASTTESVSNPMPLARVTNANYPACIAPCMTNALLPAANGVNDNDDNSSLFYDYSLDVAYVGDNQGWLHEFSPVFFGAPAEVRSGGFPVQLNPASPTPLTSPVYDETSGYVYVGDVGGFFYRIGPNSAFVVSSGQLDFSRKESGLGLVQGPIVDSTAQSIYVFSSSDGSTACAGGAACAAVDHLNTPFPPGSVGTEAIVGASTVSGAAPNPLFIGGFDSEYLNSVDATGNLYVCGDTGGLPTLYQVNIQAGALSTVTTGPAIAKATVPCSPITGVDNPNAIGGDTDWIFVSVNGNGTESACASGGCIMNFKVTPWQSRKGYQLNQEILDTNFHIQAVIKNGTSGTILPAWQTAVGAITTDGAVHWIDQGIETATTPASWAALHIYAKNTKILDPNGNIEYTPAAGLSSITIPNFNLSAGATTADATLVWTNLGANPTAALTAAGGASGVVFDNTVSATLAGASQAYFTTLADQKCGTSGTGGCAVQASQSALK